MDDAGDVTATPLGRFLKARRIAAGFERPGRLARLLRPGKPAATISRLGSRIRYLEEECLGDRTLFDEVVAALGITPDELAPVFDEEEAFRRAREAEYRRGWEAWADLPIRPFLVTKAIPGIYFSKESPPTVTTLEEAEAWAAGVMREEGFRNPWPRCLIFSRRLGVWLDRDGNVTERRPSTPDGPAHPRTRTGNKLFLFGADRLR